MLELAVADCIGGRHGTAARGPTWQTAVVVLPLSPQCLVAAGSRPADNERESWFMPAYGRSWARPAEAVA
jgi:hypothetical protein